MIEIKERVIAERDDVVKQLQEQLGEQSKLMEQMQKSIAGAGEGEDVASKEDAWVLEFSIINSLSIVLLVMR